MTRTDECQHVLAMMNGMYWMEGYLAKAGGDSGGGQADSGVVAVAIDVANQHIHLQAHTWAS